MFDKLSERFTRVFERPAPVLYCDIEAIEASSPPGFFDGYFIIKNVGGGNLEGDIFAQSSFINLSTQTVEGNDVIIEYEVDLNHLQKGDTFASQIVLTTSGGQCVLPVRISIEPEYIILGRHKIYSLEEFSEYARDIPEEAVKLFASDEYEKWLISLKCKHMEFYKKMSADAGIKEMDSFLTVCGVKEKASVNIENTNIEIPVSPEDGVVTGHIALTCPVWGFFEYKVKLESNAPWLKILKYSVSSADFFDNGFLYPFSVDASLLRPAKNRETIVFENNQHTVKVNVSVLTPTLFTVKPSRLSYKSEDSGYLVCFNRTGKNALVEVNSSEGFVRFRASKYVCENVTEIPFEIKVNSFLNLGIGKKPINISNVHIKAVIDGRVYKETVVIKAGSLLSM